MTVRLTLAICLLAGSTALAQPAAKAAPAAVDDLQAFDKDLDALFVKAGLTADQAAGRAAKVSPTVRHRAAEVSEAIANALLIEFQRIPVLAAKVNYTRLSSIPAFVIPIGGMNVNIPFLVNSYDANAVLTVPLSDYVLRYPKLVEAVRLGEDAARVSQHSEEVTAGQDARLVYYEWVRARLQVMIAQRQLTQVQATLKQVRALADVQRLSKADLLRVESQEAQAQQTVDQLKNLATLREEQLRLDIGAPDGEPLAIGEDIRQELAAPGAVSLEELVKHAVARRLDLRELELAIAAKTKEIEGDRANGYPRLSAFGTVDEARPNPRVFPQEDVFKFTWSVGIGIAWQLSDTLNERALERRLTAQTDELRADRENLLRGTRIELLSAQQAVQLALLSLETSRKGLIAAEEGYRVRKELLNAERATAVELVDAETDLTRARIAALNARVDLRVALVQLAHALGDDSATRAAP